MARRLSPRVARRWLREARTYAPEELKALRRAGATLGAAIACLVTPPVLDGAITRGIHRMFLAVRPRQVGTVASQMEALLGADSSRDMDDWEECARLYWLMRIEVRWLRARALVPWDHTLSVEVEGREHLEAACAAGRGAILWRSIDGSRTAVNATLASMGCPLVHLSHENHMRASSSWFGSRVIPRLHTHDEARWLTRRVLMYRGTRMEAVKELRGELEQGRVVSIVGTMTHGRSEIELPLGRGIVTVPSGAPSLARATGAPILPCAAVRTGPFAYRVIIEGDIAAPPQAPRTEGRRVAAERFVEHLERMLHEYPDSSWQWGSHN